MARRREVLQTLGAGATVALAGCSSGDGAGAAERTVTDGMGRTVAVPDRVERLVGVGPGALRQIAYLGATDRVVGVESEVGVGVTPYRLANPDLADRPVIGSAGPNAGGNTEAILGVDPDLIVFYGDPSRAETLQSQTDTPVLALDIVDIVDRESRATMFETWRLLGAVLDRGDRAETLIAFVEETIDDLAERTASIPDAEREDAYAGAISYKGAHGLATTRKRFAPFRWTGVDNVASDIDTDAPSVQIDPERLLAWDPATLFLAADNLDRARADLDDSTYASNDAIETGELYTLLPHASYHHNYGSILANATFVGKTVYPDRFADVRVAARADEIFEAMLGAPLIDDLREAYPAIERIDP
ncbi:ABC transporter substrate-binding protein [Halococcoides cellulosivorans]|uniref:ABC transporter substrate-binding protein n=1 Tax=Halococcoides cellulosivorans TaxID=1679096 RepID=A0A2R4WXN2_9EURY|nr:ABC transporter substrate-binding protein [Halococcoides cellulosivorans]AWB26296.1 ABC transporter substrate-binding protein [Halococcoides cellulosivorans]